MSTNNVLHTNSDRSTPWLGGQRTEIISYTNSTGDTVTIEECTVIGVITSTGKALPLKSTATNGSQNPKGLQLNKVVVADGATIDLHVVIGGDVDKGKIVFALEGDSLDTVIYNNLSSPTTDQIALGRLGDLIVRNSHINLVASTDTTAYNNTAS